MNTLLLESHPMLIGKVHLAAAGIAVIGSTAAPAQVQVVMPSAPSAVVIAPGAPPPPRIETIPPPPTEEARVMYWQSGHWTWDGANWIWINGQYVPRPTPAAVWTPGHWAQEPTGGYVWVTGRWEG